MKFYHGSKSEILSIKKNQAGKSDKIEVPENELLNAIYLTPDYEFALACGARPNGITNIDHENKTIVFEKPELFDPNKEVFVYEADTSGIKESDLIKVDDYQYAVDGVEKIGILNKFKHKAVDIEKYYELKNWNNKESRSEFKMK